MTPQQIEALKLALEWAEAHGEIVFAGGGMDAVNKMNSWATAIKEALAQPEQEPDYWLGYGLQAHTKKPFEGATPVYTSPPQRTDQEPVCPECKAVVLYECVACSSNNYPPKENT